MLKQIQLTKSENNIKDNLVFYTKCSFCKVLYKKTKENRCLFCRKYLNYVKIDSAMLFSLKNLITEISLRKRDFAFSHYDFLELEKSLVKITDQNLCFTYNPENLMWYVDVDFEVYDKYKVKYIYDTCIDVLNFFFEELNLNKHILELEKPSILQKIELFYDHRAYSSFNERLVMPDFSVLKLNSPSFFVSSFRSNITRNFYDHLLLVDNEE